jgi:L-lysine 2,3-aminomutase
MGNARDPLLLQVLPQAMELQEQAGFVSDPLEEQAHNPVPGLIHKYASRVSTDHHQPVRCALPLLFPA